MKIGVLGSGYAGIRLFLNKIGNAKYKNLFYVNFYLWRYLIKYLQYRKGKVGFMDVAHLIFYRFRSIVPNGCDVLHFFNTVNFSSKKWVVSVETLLPWLPEVTRCVSVEGDFESLINNKDIEKTFECLSKDNCRGLLFLSQCSYNMQLNLLRLFPKYCDAISKKMIVLHPPQELLISNIDAKPIDWNASVMRFVFVGRDFFRKGGRELIDALSVIQKEYKFKIVVISSLRVDSEKFIFSKNESENMKKILQETEWVEYYGEMPNAHVLETIKGSHLAFLPTWGDTYAYSVLECQACGTPVVTTSLRALVEINNSDVGYPISVPLNQFGEPILNTERELHEFRDIIIAGIIKTVRDIFENRNILREKAERCIARIKNEHSPAQYAEKLRRLYN